jgi:hypothetical protein
VFALKIKGVSGVFQTLTQTVKIIEKAKLGLSFPNPNLVEPLVQIRVGFSKP